MLQPTKAAFVAAALATALATPAAAGDAASVVAKIGEAQAAVSSYRIELTSSFATSTTTFVKPQRLKMEVRLATGLTQQSYVVDDVFYTNMTGEWQKATFDRSQITAMVAQTATLKSDLAATLLPDRTEDGATVGVLQYTVTLPAGFPMAGGSGPQSLTCTYDKATYLQRTCTSMQGTVTFTTRFTNYKDPANVVELPPEAKNAKPLAFPFVVPTPAPSPQAH
ncbi:MAG: hypothetical protein ABR591_10155 [Candidatus Velthaea sp.]